MINLGEVLKGDVPNSGTVREQIEYINLALIDSDPNNFYELSDIDQLAANIELCGLQQPIRVRVNPDDPNRVIIVSGHRRRAAIEKLVQDGREDLKEVPCIREVSDGSDALRELRLIYANSDTRRMSAADISKQVERVQALLYQLKEEGIEFPGRMRDHVAEACKISKSKISRLKVIRDRLNPCWVPAFESGDLSESTAYALAQISAEQQRLIFHHRDKANSNPRTLSEYSVRRYNERFDAIDALECAEGGPCANCLSKREKALTTETGSWVDFECGECCEKCSELARCKRACPKLAAKVAELKAEAKEKQQREAAEAEERNRPAISRLMDLWHRYGIARAMAGKTVEESYKAAGQVYNIPGEQVVASFESMEAEFTRYSTLPYGYGCHLDDVEKFVRVADLFGCSVDYLFGRTDVRSGLASAIPTGLGECHWYPAAQFPDDKQEIIAIDKDWYVTDATFQNGRLRGAGFDWDEVLFWTPAPDPDGIVRNAPQPSGQLMIAGWMPGGTTPAEPCEVIAVFSIGGTPVKRISLWNGSQFTFSNGTPIEQEPVKWMRLPPDEEDAT